MSTKTGASALSGQKEYINVNLFEEVDHDRKITGEGKSIMCYDPKAEENSPPTWEFENTSFDSVTVLAGHKVRIIGATVVFTSTSAGIS